MSARRKSEAHSRSGAQTPILFVLGLVALPLACISGQQAPPTTLDVTVRYENTPADNVITRLQKRMDAGQIKLQYDADHGGYLASVLKALDVPKASQMLVFSKTSVQKDLISPEVPRALYFNDRVYIGYVPTGPVLEIAAVDPQLGATYYNLLQRQRDQPKFFRNIGQCMECHGGKNPDHLPIHIIESVYADKDGTPIEGMPIRNTTDTTPFKERWGGWYVTGNHGEMRHMGNTLAERHDRSVTLDVSVGANVTNLRSRVDTTPYLTRHSDIVALMVFEHQLRIQNLISRANYATTTAIAARRDGVGTPAVRAAIKDVCEPLVRGLLFAGEAPIGSTITGTSGFSAAFEKLGPFDRFHRSLRQFDLTRRLFKYPCSYLIYSDAFDALPKSAKDYVYGRIKQIMTHPDEHGFGHLSGGDRKAVDSILQQTRSGYKSAKTELRP